MSDLTPQEIEQVRRLLRQRAFRAPASADRPGYVTTGAQTIAGAKTFSGILTPSAGVDLGDVLSAYTGPTFESTDVALTINGVDVGATVETCTWVRIGQLIFFQAFFQNIDRDGNGNPSGSVRIVLPSSMPVAIGTSSVHWPVTIGHAEYIGISTDMQLVGFINAGSRTIYLRFIKNNAAYVNMTDAYISNPTAADLMVSGFYLAAS